MNDRELEARLRALYGSRAPAEEVAPTELRSELVGITRGALPAARLGDSRAWTLLAAAALLGAMLIGGAMMAGSGFLRSTTAVLPSNPPGATATPTPSSSAPVPSDKPWPTGPWDGSLAWPGTGASPAGLYVWDPFSIYGWMHKVPYGPPEDDSVELKFRVTTDPVEIEALAETIASLGDALDLTHPIEVPSLAAETWVDQSGASAVNGVAVEPGAPGASLWKVTGTWMMDVNGRVIAIDVTTYANTTPELVAEAEAAIRSFRPERPDAAATPVPSGYPYPLPRFIFELTQGWDRG
jgi:hypothetical protein